MSIVLSPRVIQIKPHQGVLNSRDPDGTGDFETGDPGTISFSGDLSREVDEDIGTMTVAVVRTGGAGAASVDYATQDGTALAGTSYTAASGTLSWADGETGSRSFTVDITHRESEEQGDLSFSLVLSNASGAQIKKEESGQTLDTKTVTIIDLDEPDAGAAATVIWNGDLSTGDFAQWETSEGAATTTIVNQMGEPRVMRPPESVGGPSEGTGLHGHLGRVGGGAPYLDAPGGRGQYAARFRLPNQSDADTEYSAEGLSADPETGDYRDPAGGSYSRRRSEIRALHAGKVGLGLVEGVERWVSVSIYLPPNWDLTARAGNAFPLLQAKGTGGDGAPPLTIRSTGEHWELSIAWSEVMNPSWSDIPWQYEARYTPETASSRIELEDDYPDIQTSKNALASKNVGGWTDWVMRVKPDPRSNDTQGVFYESGGEGLIDVYKREDDGPWVHVVEYRPRAITIGSETYSRGVLYRDSDERFYLRSGIYASTAGHVLDASPTRLVWETNVRVYAGDSTLTGIEEMLQW